MRSNQQSKRSRNRGNNRKSSNPLSRNYESNGPDVRIRGNAAHVAEKYTQLARDANSSGDSVAAENYLQHAEHYNRIILSAQAQQQAQQQTRGDQNDNRSDNGGEQGDNTPDGRDKAEAAGDSKPNGQDRSVQSDPEPAEDASEAKSDESGEDKPARARRPRRKPRGEDQAEGDTVEASEGDDSKPKPKPRSRRKDPADSPQPNVEDLPPFVTDSEVNAAE